MNKGLKALRKIKNVEVVDDERDDFNTFPITAYLKEELSIIEKELKTLEIISQNFKLVGNCLHAKNKYAESGWVFVKELENEEEHNAWKEVLL